MVNVRTKDGKVLMIDGKVAIDEACCDCGCPCIPLNTLPVLCKATLTTPFGDFVFDTGDAPNARVNWTSEVIDGVCWLFYDHTLVDNHCLGDCEDKGHQKVSDVAGTAEGFCCTEAQAGTCFMCLGIEECEGSLPSGTREICYVGEIVWGDRTIASTATLRVQYKYDCENEIWYRKIHWDYFYNHYVIGYFRGVLQVHIVINYEFDPENPDILGCYVDQTEVVRSYNSGCASDCVWETVKIEPANPESKWRWPNPDTEPVPTCTGDTASCACDPPPPPPEGGFDGPGTATTPCLNDDENLVCKDFPQLVVFDSEVWMGQFDVDGGLCYGVVLFPYYSESWTVVASPFEGFTMPTAKLATPASIPLYHSCSVEDDVPVFATVFTKKTDYTFEAPSGDWTCWETYEGECTPKVSDSCAVAHCGSNGPPGVETIPGFCFDYNTDPADDPVWPDRSHSITFETVLQSATCPE
jgi:hypothetical protein